MMHLIYIAILLLINPFSSSGHSRPACGQVPLKSSHKKENIEKRILNSVSALPEVKQFMLTTPKSYKPALLLAGAPDSTSKYYWVKVGISNADMFRTNFNFLIDPKTFQILFMDMMCDSGNCNITLAQWRHLRNTLGFNKMHFYKHGKLVVLAN